MTPQTPPLNTLTGDVTGTRVGSSMAATVARLTETSGPTTLTIGAVAEGQFLTRSGTTLIGASAGGLTDSQTTMLTLSYLHSLWV